MEKLLICYDITDDRNRLKVMKGLRSKGFHAQLSFFEVQAQDPETVLRKVRDFIEKTDRFAVLKLSGKGKIRRVGGLFEGMEWVL